MPIAAAAAAADSFNFFRMCEKVASGERISIRSMQLSAVNSFNKRISTINGNARILIARRRLIVIKSILPFISTFMHGCAFIRGMRVRSVGKCGSKLTR
jgi:hypothetical protein